MMYSAMLPKTSVGLTIAELGLSALNLIWAGIAVAVIGGSLITLSKFGPRLAVEPIPVGVRGSRFRVTFNGNPVRFGRPAKHRQVSR